MDVAVDYAGNSYCFLYNLLQTKSSDEKKGNQVPGSNAAGNQAKENPQPFDALLITQKGMTVSVTIFKNEKPPISITIFFKRSSAESTANNLLQRY